MINFNNPILSSLTQATYDMVNNLLKEYQELNPLFKYKLYYGTNYDELAEEDEFGIFMDIGPIQRIPSHYVNIKNVDSLLFAGTTTLSFNIINPVSTRYTNNVDLTLIEDKEFTNDFLDQDSSNFGSGLEEEVFDELTLGKIQESIRLLEGLSLYMYRKGIIQNNFEFTLIPDIPVIAGQYEQGLFRLVEEISCDLKFQDKTTFNVISGENCLLYFKLNNKWEQFYSIIDFSFGFGAVDTTYPKSPFAVTQNIINQGELSLEFSAPAITNIGANKILRDYILSCDLSKIQNLQIKYSEDNGVTWKTTKVNITGFAEPKNINVFTSQVYTLHVLEPITKYEGD